MKKKDLEKYETLLLAKRAEILGELGLLKKNVLDTTTKDSSGDLSGYSYHMADQGTDAEEREKAFLLASKSGRLLYHIDEALRRIKDKTFGKCQECGEEISTARLEAVPHARLCINCKEKEEKSTIGETQ
ncbi:MAG TPA: TraR/DksA family transcriptional regulator [candidate division Zixibacteria bacterium]|nr:TraR/DksA family transcriptional regulator [candidate division Zixibacteria bacterium]